MSEPANKTQRPVINYAVLGGKDTTYYRQGFNTSMADLASSFSKDLRAPVVDQTGIKGSYDFRFDFNQDASDPTPGGYLFEGIQQIGLKLKPAKVLSRTIFVDHAEKPAVD